MARTVMDRISEKIPRKLMVFGVIDSITLNLLWVIYAPFLKSLGYSGFEYGLLGSIMSFSGLLATLLIGWQLDRMKVVKLFTYILLIDSLSILLIATGVKELIMLQSFIYGFTGQIFHISYNVLLSRISREKDYHYTYSYLFGMRSLGRAIGAYMGWIPGLLSFYLNIPIHGLYRWVIVTIALTRLPLIPIIGGVKEPDIAPRIEKPDIKEINIPWKTIGKFVIVGGLIGFGASISIHNISYYFVLKYNVESGELGSIYGSIDLFMAILSFILPDLAQRMGGSLRLYLLLTSSSIPLLIGITLINNYLFASAIYVIRSILMNVANPLYTAFQMKIIPPMYRGRAAAIFNVSWMLPIGIGRGLGGYLLDIDLELPLRLTAILYVFSLAVLSIFFKEYIVKGEIKRK